MQQDDRILAARAHWSGRMITNGVPLSDFQDIVESAVSWADWCRLWSEKGEFHKKLGELALKKDRTVSAGNHFKTASICYHFGKFLFVEYPEEMKIAHYNAIECYNIALPLMSPPGIRIEIPYEKKSLFGNLRLPLNVKKPPVIIMIMGLDSTKEEMFTYEADFLDRGIATFSFDGPGQGEGEYDFKMCPEYEKPLSAVIKKLKQISSIDANRIGVWGVSMGGYYAPRAAAFCSEVLACIALSGPFDLSHCFDRLPKLTASAVMHRSGAKTPNEIKAFNKRMSLRGVAENIRCPLYIVSGSLDKVIPPSQGDLLKSAAVNASEVFHNVIENGGHVANNRAYAYRYDSADWMKEKLSA